MTMPEIQVGSRVRLDPAIEEVVMRLGDQGKRVAGLSKNAVYKVIFIEGEGRRAAMELDGVVKEGGEKMLWGNGILTLV